MLIAAAYIDFVDTTVPGTPASGNGRLYVNSDKIFFKSDAGTAYDLTLAATTAANYPIIVVNTLAEFTAAITTLNGYGGGRIVLTNFIYLTADITCNLTGIDIYGGGFETAGYSFIITDGAPKFYNCNFYRVRNGGTYGSTPFKFRPSLVFSGSGSSSSAVVTFSGGGLTASGAKAGDYLQIGSSSGGQIKSVDSDTQLTLFATLGTWGPTTCEIRRTPEKFIFQNCTFNYYVHSTVTDPLIITEITSATFAQIMMGISVKIENCRFSNGGTESNYPAINITSSSSGYRACSGIQLGVYNNLIGYGGIKRATLFRVSGAWSTNEIFTDGSSRWQNTTSVYAERAFTELFVGDIGSAEVIPWLGTGTATYKLHVNNPGNYGSYIKITNGTTGMTGTDGLSLGIESDGVARIYNHENTALEFYANSARMMYINPSTSSLTMDTGVRINTAAVTATRAGLNIPHGTAPSSPVDGDIWTTTAGMYVQINTSTIGPLGLGMTYPGAGIPVSTGSAWGTSLAANTFVMNNQANSFGDFAQTFKDNSIRINNPADTFYYNIVAAAIGANRVITIPLLTGDDTLVTEAFAQTLTNKTISAASNTLTGVAIISGTPTDNRLAVWTSATQVEGASNMTYDGSTLAITAAVFITGNIDSLRGNLLMDLLADRTIGWSGSWNTTSKAKTLYVNGQVGLAAGATGYEGGDIRIQAGTGGAGTSTNGDGADLYLFGGDKGAGAGSGGAGGSVYITGRTGYSGSNGNVYLAYDGTSQVGTIYAGGPIYPITNGQDLGSTSYRWDLYGGIVNADGLCTFTNATDTSNPAILISKTTAAATNDRIMLQLTNGSDGTTSFAGIGLTAGTSGQAQIAKFAAGYTAGDYDNALLISDPDNGIVLRSSGGSGTILFMVGGTTNKWLMNSSAHFIPQTNNAFDIGTSSLGVRTLYASTSILPVSNNAVDIGSNSYALRDIYIAGRVQSHDKVLNKSFNTTFSNSSAENTWLSYSVPANTLGNNVNVLRVTITGYLSVTTDNDTLTLRIKYGATTLFGDVTAAITFNATYGYAFKVEFTICNNGATNAQRMNGTFMLGKASAGSVAGVGDLAAASETAQGTFRGTATIDSTSAQTLAVTGQLSTATNAITIENTLVELL